MKEIIDELVNIDKRSKQIVQKSEDKEQSIDNYITIELERRKNDINSKYKYKINFLKSECEKDFNNKKEALKQNSQKIIEDLQIDYNNNKNAKIEKMLTEIFR